MERIAKLLADVWVLKSPNFSDPRGTFTKLFQQTAPDLQAFAIRQINYVENHEAGILRGLHYQRGEWAESKFFRALRGRVQLAIADLRPQSTTYGQSATYLLDQPSIGVLVPRGYATGYLVLEPHSDVLYYSDNDYQPTAEGGIRWNDPHFRIDWQTTESVVLSDKDQRWTDFL